MYILPRLCERAGMGRALEHTSHSNSVYKALEQDDVCSNTGSTGLSSLDTPGLSGADKVSSFCNSTNGKQDQSAATGSGDTWPAGPCMASNSDLHEYESLSLAVDAIQLTSSNGIDAAAFLPEDLAAPQGIAAELDGDNHGAFGATLFAGPFAMLAIAADPDDFYEHIADAPLDLAPWPSVAAQHPSATVPSAAAAAEAAPAAAAAAASATAAAAEALHERWQELQQQYHFHLCAPDDIDASTPLGEGGYATVYAGRYKGREVAVKVVKVPAPQQGQQVDQEALRIEAELALVKELEAHLHAQRHAHPHIIRVVAYCREALAILLERCDTTLEARVKALRGQSQPQQHHQQPEQQQQQECQWQVWLGVLSQLASAVCHLHSEGCLLLHNDLKAANVLLQGVSTGTDSTSWQLKVADFGLACKAESAHSVAGLQVPVSISHNPLWLAPELMVEGGVATLAADIYSLGCVMYEVLTGGRTPRVADDDRPDVVSLRVRIQAEGRKLCPLEFPPDDTCMPCLRRSPPTDVENSFKACSSVDRAARPTAHDVLARLQQQCVC